jgi:hypothetical protein
MRLFLTDASVDWHRLAEIVHLPVVPDEPQESR